VAKTYVGIDLGTTNTTCAVAELGDDGNLSCRRLRIQPRIDISTGEVSWSDEPILRSVVWLADQDNVYTGNIHMQHGDVLSTRPDSKIVHGIKSELANDHWALQHNGQTWTPAAISSCLLRTVLTAVESQVHAEIDGLIITIPSSFSSAMRRQTLRAAQMARLPMEKVSLLDEPIAALFSDYTGGERPFPKIETEGPILIFDMGGGTVDVTVLSVRPNVRVVDVHASSRYNQVAGDDLDLEIAAHLWRRLRERAGASPALSRASALSLVRAGESAKLALNEAVRTIVNGDARNLRDECRKRGVALRATLDLSPDVPGRHEFEISVSDLLDLLLPFISRSERDRNYGRNIFTAIEQALDRAGSSGAEVIRQVHLVGGGANFHPVFCELQSFFRVVSRSLDPTYAVSLGAARFAALAANEGWRVSESTSERIYLRRSGNTFLEVLPAKLPIPSEPTAPSRPLEGNDTIEMPEDSSRLLLDFFQGSQENDPQMAALYAAKVSFRRALTKGTVMHSMVGHIDANKIYHFRIGLTEPNGDRTSATVEFSADDDGYSTSAAVPRYLLNSHAALARFINDDPPRVDPRVRFSLADPRSPLSNEQPIAEESLLVERNALLIAINEAWSDAYVGDKYLPTRMRITLSQLQMLQITPGVSSSERPHLELVTLYEQYGAIVIRSLLDHSFLLYGDHDLEGKLGPVQDALREDLRNHPQRLQRILAELNQHGDSPFDVVRHLVEVLLNAASDVPRLYEQILAEEAFSTSFKLIAAQVLGEPLDAAARLLRLLEQQLAIELEPEQFNRRVRPIVAVLADTGADGFQLTLDAFDRRKLGHAGGLVLGRFGESFYEWATQQKTLPARYVPAVFHALDRISRVHLDYLIRLLLDRWSLDPKVAASANEGFRRLPRRRLTTLLEIVGESTRRMVNDLVRQPSADDQTLMRKVREAAIRRDGRGLQSIRRERGFSEAVADALTSNLDDDAAAFLLHFSTSGNARFLRQMLGRLLRWRSFGRLNEAQQRLVLQTPATQRMASVAMLERIKDACKPPLHPLVVRMISEKYRAATTL